MPHTRLISGGIIKAELGDKIGSSPLSMEKIRTTLDYLKEWMTIRLIWAAKHKDMYTCRVWTMTPEDRNGFLRKLIDIIIIIFR